MSRSQEIAELRKRLDELESKVSDPLPDYVAEGQVVRFQKRFGGKSYTYAALRSRYVWYLTGRDHHTMTDTKFRGFLADAENIEVALVWRRLDEQE